MDQLELLWEYQQADIEADKFETAIKRSPTRQKCLKCRDILLEQQENAKKIEDEINARADRIAILKEAVKKSAAQLRDFSDKSEKNPADSLETVSDYMSRCREIASTVASYEQEIAQIVHDMAVSEKQEKEILANYNKYKAEYGRLKEEWDKENKEKTAELEKMRSEVEKKSSGISSELMEHYKTIKLRVSPPLAKLRSNQCGGCNMSLPSAVARNLKSGQMVECETCGRMLML